jgi:aldose 1-epimerase
MNATGKSEKIADQDRYHLGIPFEGMQFDNVFGQLLFEGQWCRARVADPQSGRTMTMAFDDAFREIVVYTPPHREAICIEPYTCVPDCFRLAGEGIDAGLRVLNPGQSFTARVVIQLD